MPGDRYTTPERNAIGAEAQYGTPARLKRQFNISHSQFYSFKKRYAQGSPMKTKRASGRPPKLSSVHTPRITKIISQNRRLSLEKLRLKCATVAPEVSLKTFRLFLCRSGYKRYIAVRKCFLGPRERRLRRRWLRLTRNVNMDAVIFTDEAQVCVGKQGRIYVTCKASERLQTDCLAPRIRKAPGVFVWAGIWYNGRTPLVKLDLSQSDSPKGGFNSKLYKEQVLRPHLGPTFKRLNNNWRGQGGAGVMEDGNSLHFKSICMAEKGRWNMRSIYHPPPTPLTSTPLNMHGPSSNDA